MIKRIRMYLSLLAIYLCLLPLGVSFFRLDKLNIDWRDASFASTQQSPLPSEEKEAVVQVFNARLYGARGAYGVHTWLAAKPKNAEKYTRYEVIGWNLRRGKPVINISSDREPDAKWYGEPPTLIKDVRGEKAEVIIEKLKKFGGAYPYPKAYTAWPGPNSNSYIAYLGRNIPELELVMSPLAIGKDYLYSNNGEAKFFDKAVSGTGWQFSLNGLFSITLAKDEGLEINLFGVVSGVSPLRLSLKLPGIGELGFNKRSSS